MIELVIIIFVVLMSLWMLYHHYEPRIEVVYLNDAYRKIYLFYNDWDAWGYKCRSCKALFKI